MVRLNKFQCEKLIYEKFGTCQAFADAVGLTRPRIYQIMNYSNQLQYRTIAKLAKTLGVTVEEITIDEPRLTTRDKLLLIRAAEERNEARIAEYIKGGA